MEFFGLLLTMVPLVLLAFIFNWVHTLKSTPIGKFNKMKRLFHC